MTQALLVIGSVLLAAGMAYGRSINGRRTKNSASTRALRAASSPNGKRAGWSSSSSISTRWRIKLSPRSRDEKGTDPHPRRSRQGIEEDLPPETRPSEKPASIGSGCSHHVTRGFGIRRTPSCRFCASSSPYGGTVSRAGRKDYNARNGDQSAHATAAPAIAAKDRTIAA
jgi:hypothetical protein